MSRLLIFLMALSCAGFPAATAEEYWIAYEGNDFPENEGWNHVYGDGHWPPQDQPDRWLDDGELVIDTSRNPMLWEYYSRSLADPEAGELFVAEWRVRVEVVGGWGDYDGGSVFARESVPGYIGFDYVPGGLYLHHDQEYVPLDVTVHHVYRVASPDMQTYTLWIDGEHVLTEPFGASSVLQAYGAFGPGVQGTSSISHWHYFRFGVVPEPRSAFLLTLGLLARRGRS